MTKPRVRLFAAEIVAARARTVEIVLDGRIGARAEAIPPVA